MTMFGSGKAAAVPLAGRSNRVRMAWLGTVLALLGLLCALSVAIGTREVSFADILGGLSGRVETVAEAAVAVRLPRTVLALIAGAALGLAGAIMQGVTRNPLADPGILGVNMGRRLPLSSASSGSASLRLRPSSSRQLPGRGHPRSSFMLSVRSGEAGPRR